MKQKLSLLLALALVLSLALLSPLPARAEIDGPPEFTGAVLASELPDYSDVRFTGEVTLTLDEGRTLGLILCGEDCELTVQGTAQLSFVYMAPDELTLNSGTLRVLREFPPEFGAQGGELPVNRLSVSRLTVNGGTLESETWLVAEELVVNGGTVRAVSDYCTVCADRMTVTGGEVYLESSFVGLGGHFSWIGWVTGCALSVSGGRLEIKTAPDAEGAFSVGAALYGMEITGGAFLAEGSAAALNSWDSPVVVGESMRIAAPAGGSVSDGPVDTEQARYGWSGYTVVDAEGSPAKSVVIEENAAPDPEPGLERFTVLSDGTARVRLRAGTAEPETLRVAVARYDGDGRFLGVGVEEVLPTGVTGEYAAELRLEAAADYRAFLLDGSDWHPLAEPLDAAE